MSRDIGEAGLHKVRDDHDDPDADKSPEHAAQPAPYGLRIR
jgi:hypothetical protein